MSELGVQFSFGVLFPQRVTGLFFSDTAGSFASGKLCQVTTFELDSRVWKQVILKASSADSSGELYSVESVTVDFLLTLYSGLFYCTNFSKTCAIWHCVDREHLQYRYLQLAPKYGLTMEEPQSLRTVQDYRQEIYNPPQHLHVWEHLDTAGIFLCHSDTKCTSPSSNAGPRTERGCPVQYWPTWNFFIQNLPNLSHKTC